MKRILIKDAKQSAGKKVAVGAWVQTIRHQGKIIFLVLRDVTGTMQAVAFESSVVEQVDELTLESVVSVKGLVKEAKQAPGGIEIEVEKLDVLSSAEPELAIPVVEKSGDETHQEKRLDWRWLDLRKPHKQLILRAWTKLSEGFREYWISNEYIEVHTPKLMGTASESGAEVFKVQYFEGEAYLAQSPQFYKQMAMAAGLERVFEVGPVFRAEPSFTTRHVTEFTGYDFEISFIDSYEEVMGELENSLIAGLTKVKAGLGDAIKADHGADVVIPDKPFPRVTMAEAKAKLAAAGVRGEKPDDVSPEEERALCNLIKKETGHEFVFLTEYPVSSRPFYHMRFEDRPEITKSFDLLWKGVEISTGAQREHRYDVLVKQAKEKKMDLKALQFYLDFFRYGCPPHGGVGIGPARIMMKIFESENIREVTFLPRTVKRLRP